MLGQMCLIKDSYAFSVRYSYDSDKKAYYDFENREWIYSGDRRFNYIDSLFNDRIYYRDEGFEKPYSRYVYDRENNRYYDNDKNVWISRGDADYNYARSYYEDYGYYRNYDRYYDRYADKNHDSYYEVYPFYRYSDRYDYPYYRYYETDRYRNYKYPYTYRQVVSRDKNDYNTKLSGNQTYYYFEKTYKGDDGKDHHYYEEFYFNRDNEREYYIEDYILNSRGDKDYVVKDRFNEKRYNDFPSRYYTDDRYYGKNSYSKIYYAKPNTAAYYNNFRNMQRKYRGNGESYYDYSYHPASSLPGKLPPASAGWPVKSGFTNEKKDIAEFLAKELFRSNASRYRQFFDPVTIRELMKKYYPESYDEDSDRITIENFMYYFGFVDDYIQRYGKTPENAQRYMDTYGDDLFSIYYDYNAGRLTDKDINSINDTAKKISDFSEDAAKNSRLKDTYQRKEDIAKGMNERLVNDKGFVLTDAQMSLYAQNIKLRVDSVYMTRTFGENNSDSIDMGAAVVKDPDSGRYMVPIGIVGANLGIKAVFNQNERYLYLAKDKTEAKVYNNSSNIIVNGELKSMGAVSSVSNNRIMLPVEILEYFGYERGRTLVVDPKTKTIEIRNYIINR